MTAVLGRVFDPHPQRGVLAVLTAADAARDKLADTQWVASFAPPITSYAQCVCGSVLEKRGTDQINVTADEKDAAAQAVADMLGRSVLDDLDPRIVARVIDAINHERACADAAADRDWDDAHHDCEFDA